MFVGAGPGEKKQHKIGDSLFEERSSGDYLKMAELSEEYLQMGGGFCLDEYGANKGTDKCPSNSAADPARVQLELLQMFGLPYIIAPMEAEAQCAYMELENLVDGVITDDSDVFLFGAQSVYKNIFNDRKYVETYFMKDIENDLGLTREKLIRMALLLGSDYTEGVSGIGIVNAIEVVNAFPEEDGLSKFLEWIESPDPTILGTFDVKPGSSSRKRGSKVSDSDVDCSNSNLEGLSASDQTVSQSMDYIDNTKQVFMDKHRNVSKNWHIPSTFPNEAVISAYVSPQVDKSTELFSWGKPDLFVLRNTLEERVTEMMGLQSWMKKELPFAVMVMLEFGDVCTTTLTKAAMNTGMNSLVFVVYHNALGTLILLPLFIFHRHRTQQPPLSFSLLCRFSLLGLLGTCLLQICLFTGINYSSPTLAAALGNLFPAFTFLLAVLFRMEKFDLRKSSSQAKSLGTIVAVSGAFVMTLYKGPPLLMATLPSNLPHRLLLSQEQPNWVLGGLFLGISCLSSSIWNIVQTATIEEYPDEITVVFFYCFFGTIQCTIFSLIAERNPTAWILTPGVEMISIVFSGIFGSFLNNAVHTWVLRVRGPVYVAMFKPLSIAIAVAMGVIFLGDTLYLGSIVGATIISVGFYTVMWGKAKEEMAEGNEKGDLEWSPSRKVPLLQSYKAQEM
ncbi:hypothetical protein ACSBR1_010716 [Camellia fascicularis]